MKTIDVKNTYKLSIKGKPSRSVLDLSKPTEVAVLPSTIDFIKPKLFVKQGDAVKIGTPLFFDKQHPEIVFLSPGSGEIKEIQYGPRRRLDAVVIALDTNEEYEPFTAYSNVNSLNRDSLVQALLKGGLWAHFKEYPFNRIPSVLTIPPSIYIALDNDAPFQPESDLILLDNEGYFKAGMMALNILTAGDVNLSCSVANYDKYTGIQSYITHEVKGDYPANTAGVVLYHNKQDASENNAWTLGIESVILMGQFLTEGRYPTERMISLGGDLVAQPTHIKTREGVSIRHIVDETEVPTRYIAGGILSGRKADKNSYLGYSEFALNVLREGKELELFTFFRPGFDKPTFSKTYLSALIPKALATFTTSLNGGHRSCIACGACPQVCPVGIQPQFLFKSVLAGDVEESLAQGLLDCTDCGLCTYVCPSKIDLDGIFRNAKVTLEKETR